MAISEGEKQPYQTTIKTIITICMYWVNPEFSGFGLMSWVFFGLGFLRCNPT